MDAMKQLRHRAIRDLVGARPIRTQQELAAALRERGFRTTQATMSRDVAELGLVKAPAAEPRPTRSRVGCWRPRRPARIGCGRSWPTCRSRSGTPGSSSSSGRCPVRPIADRGRPGSGPLAGGRGLDRGRRHGVRRVHRPAGCAAGREPPSRVRRLIRERPESCGWRARNPLTRRGPRARLSAGRTSGARRRAAWSSFVI